MPSIADLLRPRCPHHPNMLAEDYGYCCYCGMTTHKHLSGFKLITDIRAHYPLAARVAYRTEAQAYGEGIEDDD